MNHRKIWFHRMRLRYWWFSLLELCFLVCFFILFIKYGYLVAGILADAFTLLELLLGKPSF